MCLGSCSSQLCQLADPPAVAPCSCPISSNTLPRIGLISFARPREYPATASPQQTRLLQRRHCTSTTVSTKHRPFYDPPPPPNLQIPPPTMSSTQGIVASFVEGAPPGEVRSPWSRNQQHQNLPLTCARRPAGRCYRRHDPPPYSPEEPDRIEQDRETERPI